MAKNVQNVANKIFNSAWFTVIIGILLFVKTILFYNSTILVNEEIELETLIGTISFIIVIVCFLVILPNKARNITGIVINILISILLFSDNVYYVYSNSVLSVAQITNLQYGEEILNTLPIVIEFKQILYFIDIILILILIGSKFIKIEDSTKKTKKQLIENMITGILGICIFCVIGIKYVEKGQDKSYNKDLQIKETTIFGYHIYDIANALNTKGQSKYKKYNEMLVDYEALKNEYKEKYGEQQETYKGILKDKNIIVIQLESVQEFVINKKINGLEITPNLNKFINENIEIQNMNMQSYSTTADSEFSSITSLYPMENGMSYSKYYTNKYDDLFGIFNNAKYKTSYMHGNEAKFWNRGNVYSNMKVDNIDLKDKFEDTEYINGFLSDEVLYEQGIQKIEQLENPFISFVVAASSHTPFELEGLQDRKKVNIDVGKYKNTYFGNYLEAVNYADYAFGRFIENLKQDGIYDDVGILIFGDHNGLNMYNEEMEEFLKETNPNLTDIDLKLNYTKVACGLKIPQVEKMKITKPTSKLDIKPTLAYLCDIEDGFSLGTNMFENKEFVSLNNERIITDKYYYDEDWYDIQTGEKIQMDTINTNTKNLLEQYYTYMKTELEISNSISINNLLEQRGL